MDDIIGIIVVVIITGIVILSLFGVLSAIEKNESNNFWECIGENGSVDWCINQFEHDNETHIDKFYSCMDEINKLEYCHTKFLR